MPTIIKEIVQKASEFRRGIKESTPAKAMILLLPVFVAVGAAYHLSQPNASEDMPSPAMDAADIGLDASRTADPVENALEATTAAHRVLVQGLVEIAAIDTADMPPDAAASTLKAMAKATLAAVPERASWPYETALPDHADSAPGFALLRTETDRSKAIVSRLEGIAADRDDLFRQAGEAAEVLIAAAESLSTPSTSGPMVGWLALDLLKAGLDIRMGAERESLEKLREVTDGGVLAANRLTSLLTNRRPEDDLKTVLGRYASGAGIEKAWVKAFALKCAITALSSTASDLRSAAAEGLKAEGIIPPELARINVEALSEARLASDRTRLHEASSLLRSGNRKLAASLLSARGPRDEPPAVETAVMAILKGDASLASRVEASRTKADRFELMMTVLSDDIGKEDDAQVADRAEAALEDLGGSPSPKR